MSDICKWLHESLQRLPIINYPFEPQLFPLNAIYFFYEIDEKWGHGNDNQRIVRIGTHGQGNFRSRIKDHYLFVESKMNFNVNKLKPSDRSIFRKNIGRAVLNKEGDNYLDVWNIDFTYKKERIDLGHLRNIEKEKEIEYIITKIIRDDFSFKFLIIEKQYDRIGSMGLEGFLIGTVAKCKRCRASENWLGNYSPLDKIRESGLWQVQHLDSEELSENNKDAILKAIKKTKEWINSGVSI